MNLTKKNYSREFKKFLNYKIFDTEYLKKFCNLVELYNTKEFEKEIIDKNNNFNYYYFNFYVNKAKLKKFIKIENLQDYCSLVNHINYKEFKKDTVIAYYIKYKINKDPFISYLFTKFFDTDKYFETIGQFINRDDLFNYLNGLFVNKDTEMSIKEIFPIVKYNARKKFRF